MVLACKEFGSGFFKGIDQQISKFLQENNIKKEQVVSVNYSTNAVGTYALVIYDTSKPVSFKKLFKIRTKKKKK